MTLLVTNSLLAAIRGCGCRVRGRRRLPPLSLPQPRHRPHRPSSPSPSPSRRRQHLDHLERCHFSSRQEIPELGPSRVIYDGGRSNKKCSRRSSSSPSSSHRYANHHRRDDDDAGAPPVSSSSLGSIFDNHRRSPPALLATVDERDRRRQSRRRRINDDNDNDNIQQQQREQPPDYSEFVHGTAEGMRSAVRAYVEEHNNRSSSSAEGGGRSHQAGRHPRHHRDDDDDDEDEDTHGNERYSEQIACNCAQDGIAYEAWRVPPTRDAVERAIRIANDRTDVHGILVFYPISDRLIDVRDEYDDEYDDDDDDAGLETTSTTSSTSTSSPSSGPRRRRTYKDRKTGVYYRSMDDYFRDLVAREKDVEGYRGRKRGSRMMMREEPAEENEEGDDVARRRTECGGAGGDRPEEDDDDRDDDDAKPTPVEEESEHVIYPCTALAVYKILESLRSSSSCGGGVPTSPSMPTGRYYEGATMTIINRSEVLGLPLAMMLSRMGGATVYSVDVNSVLLFRPDGGVRRVDASSSAAVERCVGMSSVIVSGVPSSATFFGVPTEWIPENATAINVAAGRSNFDEGTLLTGDDASRRRGVTYIPHVGRVTVAALEYNLMSLHKKYNST